MTLAADGSLTGLPAEYSPARLQMSFADVDGEHRLSALTLDLHGKRVSLPSCLLGFVNTRRPEDLRLFASWEHDEEVIPSYLQLKLYDPGYDPTAWGNGGFSFLFDLHDAQLLEMDVDIAHAKTQVLQTVPVDLRGHCSPEELTRVVHLPGK